MVPAGQRPLRAIARSLIVIVSFLLAQTAFAANLSGTVYGDSNPLEGASVTLYDSNQLELSTILTPADGGYIFADLIDGNYWLGVSAPSGSGFGASPIEPITIAGADVQHLVTLLSGAKKLSGYLRDTQGRPIDYVTLTLYDQQTGKTVVERFSTDGQGYFEIGVAAGTYKIRLNTYDLPPRLRTRS